MSVRIVYNGELVESDQISIGVKSEGLAFGFGLFETIRFLDGRPCFLREHLDRLAKSATAAAIGFPFSYNEIYRQSLTLFNANGIRDGIFKIVLVRSRDSDNLVVFIKDSGKPFENGSIRLRLSPVVKSAEAFTSKNKTLNYMENWLEKKAAQQHGFDECFFVNECGSVTECSTANLFIVKEGFLRTPTINCGLLNGVIRGQVLRIAGELGLPIESGIIRPEDCTEADEAFITNSGKGIVSISEIYVDRLRTYPSVGSKLVKGLSEELRLAEIESTQVCL